MKFSSEIGHLNEEKLFENLKQEKDVRIRTRGLLDLKNRLYDALAKDQDALHKHVETTSPGGGFKRGFIVGAIVGLGVMAALVFSGPAVISSIIAATNYAGALGWIKLIGIPLFISSVSGIFGGAISAKVSDWRKESEEEKLESKFLAMRSDINAELDAVMKNNLKISGLLCTAFKTATNRDELYDQARADKLEAQKKIEDAEMMKIARMGAATQRHS